MAARNKNTHDAKTREKIQTTQLVKRLTGHAFGEVEMSQTQVRAAEILLKKTLPDLQAIDIQHGMDEELATQLADALRRTGRRS